MKLKIIHPKNYQIKYLISHFSLNNAFYWLFCLIYNSPNGSPISQEVSVTWKWNVFLPVRKKCIPSFLIISCYTACINPNTLLPIAIHSQHFIKVYPTGKPSIWLHRKYARESRNPSWELRIILLNEIKTKQFLYTVKGLLQKEMQLC